MVNLYDVIMREMESRKAYLYETYAPYYICSFATHAFNLMNQKKRIYWESKKLPNMRLHILFVAPPGYMKSYYLGAMGGDEFAIFKKTHITVGFEQSMTEAGFIGTMVNVNGVAMSTEGAAATFKDGLLLIDEFSAITNALKAQYNTQLDTQLLAALDHGRVYKRLGSGRIEYVTSLTLWAGVQPARYDLSSGLGRRMCFLLFLPTHQHNEELIDRMHETRNIRPNTIHMQNLWGNVNSFITSLEQIEKVTYDDDVRAKYHSMKLFSYETSYFDRLLLGWHLATYGADKHVKIDMIDKQILDLVQHEKKWRDDIGRGVDYVQLLKIIEMAGNAMSPRDLAEEALMVGWNSQQVYEKVAEMQKYGMVKMTKGLVTLV